MLFEVWAPEARRVALTLDDRERAMTRDPARTGWWRCAADATEGARYGFSLDGGPVLPDPRSRRLPDGPDGLSAVVDPDRFPWRVNWPGAPLPGAVLYELHIGTFTREGTFDAAAARLPHLAELGVTHVELMPVCPFPGTHGWGYDGVAPWAVHEPYGGPAGLARFVDAAHAAGLGVVLDVVHNHLGPSGNHLPAFGPYFTDTHHTPWGAAVNLDAPGSDEVRAYLTGSALAWLRDYRLDGLRLDAVHALADTRPKHFLAELSGAVDALAARLGRPLFLVAESDLGDPATTAPRESGGQGLHAQWNDDFHHALHTALTGESQGYYADFAADPAHALAKTLTGGFFHDGGPSSFRGRRHGRPLDPASPAHRLLGYAQTHDQIGNRATGDRLPARLSPGLLACAAALVLCGPFTPMLFMGEEWGAGTPWQYFTDHPDPALAEAVRTGRRREFAAHGWAAEDVPDPQDPATRARSCLDWTEPEREPHRALLDWHRTLIALRRATPELTAGPLSDTAVTVTGDLVTVVRRGGLCVAVNPTGGPVTVPLGGPAPEVLAAWRPVELSGADGARSLRLPAESAAVLRGG
ncbi:malto-oligosyltrehalose trehalohydrolase [Streptomyces eurocidicus]|uniref:Malto-oligosyltrehalose trehalohydrolase n=1 Tax=Streptomyces eurocidicus TaxID=66423 RepID=A0A2N8NWI6_STREU|nr:malto-oligosyltrehalose trehalohydrolase [Streptomyces eurocidicus]MBB5119184.1 maltooligosyltrehalose trehalohydrolase [Streptomyces eurocidicus]MBF6051714.1 malto-oligosyltrehalose trehalohydrolase [Streptomyces eurocidicus]PNE33134.1 malto-oligosyltrehalose trehalohydrolase [Streptomyces eurocidicus]